MSNLAIYRPRYAGRWNLSVYRFKTTIFIDLGRLIIRLGPPAVIGR